MSNLGCMESSDGLVTVFDMPLGVDVFEKKSFLDDRRALVKLFLHLLYLDHDWRVSKPFALL